jgi:hypothetical protein
MALTHDARRALAERVQRKVQGRGIPRPVIEDAISRVSDALEQPASAPAGVVGTSIIAVFTATSAPDLGSRVRAALEAESVAPIAIGTGTSGRLTVASARLAATYQAAAERVATRLSASVSFVPDSSSFLLSQ